jgi:NAD(P)-dependent dehydrogenase (short-subunit alcohol dehydrogenase family)
VTGGNRGIGLEICRQLAAVELKVVFTARDRAKGEAACARLANSGADVIFHPLDIADDASIVRLQRYVATELGRWDILVNNAGVYLDGSRNSLDIDAATFRETLAVNLTGRCC